MSRVVGRGLDFALVPEADMGVVLEEDAPRSTSEYGQRMQRLGVFAKTYAIEVVVVVLVLLGMLETVLGWNTADSGTSLWFVLPAMAVLGLVIVAHRRFPFAGPAAYWILATGIAFVDPFLITSVESFFVIGRSCSAACRRLARPASGWPSSW